MRIVLSIGVVAVAWFSIVMVWVGFTARMNARQERGFHQRPWLALFGAPIARAGPLGRTPSPPTHTHGPRPRRTSQLQGSGAGRGGRVSLVVPDAPVSRPVPSRSLRCRELPLGRSASASRDRPEDPSGHRSRLRHPTNGPSGFRGDHRAN